MSKTVLCADDSATMQKAAEITFRSSDFAYAGAKSADEALALAKANKPSFILADAVMPGKTGYDLCREAKADPTLADVPVFLLCGNSEAYDAGRGSEVGADGHLTKPWDSTKFLAQLEELLSKVEAGGVAKSAGGAAAAAPAPTPVAPAPAAPAPVAKPAVPSVVKPAPRPVAPPIATPAPRPVAPPVVKPAAPRPAPPRPVAPTPAPAPVVAAPEAPTRTAMRPPMIKGTPTKRPSLPNLAAASAAASSHAARSATLMGLPSIGMPPAKSVPGVTSVVSSGNPAVEPAKAVTAAAASKAVAAVPAAAAAVAQEAGLDPNGPEMKALVKLSKDVIERIVWEVVPDLAEAIIKENMDRFAQR